MRGATARAAVVLNEPKYLEAAEANLAFLQRELWDAESGTLYHRWRDGKRDDVQLLDAYAFLLDGVLHLYEATLEPKHLQFAIDLTGTMKAKFYDEANGGFWQSVHTQNLILKVKEDYDGAVPSGNSVAVLALLRLGKITDGDLASCVGVQRSRAFLPRGHPLGPHRGQRAHPFRLQGQVHRGDQ